MKVGYFYWGFLGDRKYNADGRQVSTPDGNAFYSWSIIKGFIDAGHKVYCLTIDRDINCAKFDSKNMFSAWCERDRRFAYNCMDKSTKIMAFKPAGDTRGYVTLENMPDLDMMLIEWRWPIPGRNIDVDYGDDWQPDLVICRSLIQYANEHNIPVVIFDLDYKMTIGDIYRNNIKYVIELGNKWSKEESVVSRRIEIPFDFLHINDFKIKRPRDAVIYIGNRYERDWCINKYLPDKSIVHGNWLESGRNSNEVWPNLKFKRRLQTADMYTAYSKCAVTPLLAKREYCKEGFVTARLIEAVFYGCLPLFIEEFGDDVIRRYVPDELKDIIVVHNKDEVRAIGEYMLKHPKERKDAIQLMRKHLKFMDAKYFVNNVLELIQ